MEFLFATTATEGAVQLAPYLSSIVPVGDLNVGEFLRLEQNC